MNALRLLPVLLSYLLLAAHFYRGSELWLVGLSLAVPCLLLLRRPWVPALVASGLLLGAAEWLYTLAVIARVRMQMGLPWERMAWILGAVVLITALSSLVFRGRSLKLRYAAGSVSPGQSES